MNTVFSQAIDAAFPLLDASSKEEIRQKVLIHITEFIKEQVYTDEKETTALEEMVGKESDIAQRSKLYGEHIAKKLATLPEEKQKDIMQKADTELVKVMHTIYSAVNK